MPIANDQASELIRWMEVPGHPNVFALGNFGRQVTFSAQQTRAFNLIWALFAANRLNAGSRVGVVGAGLGGITAALAAHAKGCEIHLYEQASQHCPLQRGNDIRFIHPNILRWPEVGFDTAKTDFPFLNWTASTVRGVIKQIDLQWKHRVTGAPRFRRFFNYRVNRLYVSPRKSGPQRPWLTANRVMDGNASEDEVIDVRSPSGYLEFSYDCVILAVGFGEERSVAGVPFLSYWENDSLHQEMVRGRRSILVSGCGDGGLIDALRLRLRNFEHAKFVRDFLTAAKSKSLVESLQAIDRDLRRYANAPDISLRFQSRYEELPVPEEVENYFLRGKRADAVVTLNSPTPGPLTFRASLLNRYAAYLAMRYADLHYLSGRIVAERIRNDSYQVTFQRDDVDMIETQSFDMIIVRHGPESVIGKLIPASAVKELESWWRENEDSTTKACWRIEDEKVPHKFFAPFQSEAIASDEDVLDLALATFDTAYREFCLDPEFESIGVGKYQGKAGFIVTLRPGSLPRQSILYATNVLVQYVSSSSNSVSRSSRLANPNAIQGHRILRAGCGIYNYDAQYRDPKVSIKTPGDNVSDLGQSQSDRQKSYSAVPVTLGCFGVAQGTEEKYLISTYAVGMNQGAGAGDRIYLEGQDPEGGYSPVAIVWRAIPLTEIIAPAGDWPDSGIGIMAARLEADVRHDYAYLPKSWQPKSVGPATTNAKVTKVGRTSGVTSGLVFVTDIDVPVNVGGSGPVAVSKCMLIAAEDGSEFSMPGDSGAMVVREDGTAVGLVMARSQGSGSQSGITVAFPLSLALQKLGLDLLPAGTTNHGQVLVGSKKTKARHKR